MKVFAHNELQTLSLVTPRPQSQNPFTGEVRHVNFERGKRPRISGGELKKRLSLLSAVDVTRVNQVTIREGESHCVWPPDILRKFWSADVIKSDSTSHYVLRDGNVTRKQ
jgi:hypothetical protein